MPPGAADEGVHRFSWVLPPELQAQLSQRLARRQWDESAWWLAVAGLWLAGLMVAALLWKFGEPIRDFVAAVSVGVVDGVPVLDLDYPEDSACDTDMNVVMTAQGGFVELQGTADGVAFSRAEMNALLDLAEKGTLKVIGGGDGRPGDGGCTESCSSIR